MGNPVVKLSRDLHFTNKVLVVDGLSGVGKSAIYPPLQALKRVENVVIDYVFEYVCISHFLNQIPLDASKALLKILADHKIYEMVSARGVNFRPSDITSVLKGHLRSTYLDRLFKPDGIAALKRVEVESPIFHIMTHQLFAASKPMFEALGKRLVFVEVIRNPLHTLRHQLSYIERYGTDVRDFSLWIDFKGRSVPWFALGHEETYLSLNSMDKVIYVAQWFEDMRERHLKTLTEEEKECHVPVFFDSFVKKPFSTLRRIASQLETEPLPCLEDVLKEHNIPRKLANDGLPGGGVWAQLYAAVPPETDSTEENELAIAWDLARSMARPPALNVLEKLVENFEKFYKENESQNDN